MIIHILRDEIKKALSELGAGDAPFNIEHPTVISHGDFATNASLVASKVVGKAPPIFARELMEQIERQKVECISHMEIAGPGFINFFVKDEVFHHEMSNVNETYGKSNLWENKKILVEHSSPNLFKPFHIGHLMNNAVGESITRLAKYSGAEVTTISYPSDVSLGIGKAIYVVLKDGIEKVESLSTKAEKLAYLGNCYAQGNALYEDDPTVKQKVKDITEDLFDLKEGETLNAYKICKEINLEYFIDIAERLGSKFDAYIFESEAGIAGEKIVRENIGKIYKESDGAVIYEGEQDGLHTRVFINKEGRPTYEAKDTGLLSIKFSRFNPDLSIFITDHEQQPYFEVVASAAGKIMPRWKNSTIHRTHGRMTFKGQKMSSRLGGVPLASEILDTLAEEVREKAKNLSPEDVDAVAIAAIKFVILRTAAGKNINFDPETSLSFEGDSGPYLQYTTVRARSVLQKAEIEGFFPEEGVIEAAPATLVEKTIARFPEVVELAVKDWAPHHVASYLLELAQSYNSWYGNTKLIDVANKNMAHNLFVTKAAADVIEKGLWLLGIKTPLKM